MAPQKLKPDDTLIQNNHIAHIIRMGENLEVEKRVLRVRNGNVEPPAEQIKPILRQMGLYYVCTFQAPKLSHNISSSVVSALVERWRPETHTFHLPHGECAVTLQDVSILLGLPILGIPACTDVTTFNNETLSNMCRDYLGVIPPADVINNSFIKLAWLDTCFSDSIRRDAHQFDFDTVIQWHARGYILRLFGHVLFVDKYENKVHGKYLAMLRDLNIAKDISWGAAVLAVLNRNLCRATRVNCAGISGCQMLLVAWAYFRFPKFAPVRIANENLYEFPLASRWNHSVGWQRNFRYRNVWDIREAIDNMQPNEFIWNPYEISEIVGCVPDHVRAMHYYWPTVCPLICIEVVEWHAADHVMRQFGLQQPMPTNLSSLCMGSSHNRDLRRNPQADPIDWMKEHEGWHDMWMTRNALDGIPIIDGDYSPSLEYWEWFNYHGLCLYVSPRFHIPDIPNRPRPHVFYMMPSPPPQHPPSPPQQEYYTPMPPQQQFYTPQPQHLPFSQLLSFDMTQLVDTEQYYSGVASSSQVPELEMQPHRSSCYVVPSDDDARSSRTQAVARHSVDVASSSHASYSLQMGLASIPPQPSFVEEVPTRRGRGNRRGNIFTRGIQRLIGRRGNGAGTSTSGTDDQRGDDDEVGDGPERYNLRLSGERRAPNRYTPSQPERGNL